MFRPNRIGTPNFYDQQVGITDSDPIVLTEGNVFQNDPPCNVVNVNPIQDYGNVRFMKETGSTPHNLTDEQSAYIVASFTVTKPIEGNVRGVEFSFAFETKLTPELHIQAFCGKINEVPPIAAAMDPTTFENFPVPLTEVKRPTTEQMVAIHVIGQIVLSCLSDNEELAGLYAIGVKFTNISTGAAAPVGPFSLSLGLRQLNDQQNVGYADTLR